MPENIEKKEPLPEEEGQVIELDDAEEKEDVQPESNENRPAVEVKKEEEKEEEDLSDYSASVKKRIAKLTNKFRDTLRVS